MITATETEVVPYRAEDGLEMLRQVDVDFPDAEEWCRDAEGKAGRGRLSIKVLWYVVQECFIRRTA